MIGFVPGEKECLPLTLEKLELRAKSPFSPCLIGKEACSHWVSDRAEFESRLTADLRRSSKICREELLTNGEQRNKCCTLGALNEALRMTRASCALIRASLSSARANSSHLFDHADSKAVPGNNGAPRSSVSDAST